MRSRFICRVRSVYPSLIFSKKKNTIFVHAVRDVCKLRSFALKISTIQQLTKRLLSFSFSHAKSSRNNTKER